MAEDKEHALREALALVEALTPRALADGHPSHPTFAAAFELAVQRAALAAEAWIHEIQPTSQPANQPASP